MSELSELSKSFSEILKFQQQFIEDQSKLMQSLISKLNSMKITEQSQNQQKLNVYAQFKRDNYPVSNLQNFITEGIRKCGFDEFMKGTSKDNVLEPYMILQKLSEVDLLYLMKNDYLTNDHFRQILNSFNNIFYLGFLLPSDEKQRTILKHILNEFLIDDKLAYRYASFIQKDPICHRHGLTGIFDWLKASNVSDKQILQLIDANAYLLKFTRLSSEEKKKLYKLASNNISALESIANVEKLSFQEIVDAYDDLLNQEDENFEESLDQVIKGLSTKDNASEVIDPIKFVEDGISEYGVDNFANKFLNHTLAEQTLEKIHNEYAQNESVVQLYDSFKSLKLISNFSKLSVNEKTEVLEMLKNNITVLEQLNELGVASELDFEALKKSAKVSAKNRSI